MTVHPLVLLILLIDLMGLIFLLSAGRTALLIRTGWAPGAATRRQLALEAAAETAALKARGSLVLSALASVLVLSGVSNVFPAMVPGAMCGTGVMQAAGDMGSRALLLRLVLFGMLYTWHVLETLNMHRPESPLTFENAGLLLLSLPVALMAAADTGRAFWGLETQQPVSCCAVVYDAFQDLAQARLTWGLSGKGWAALLLGQTALVIGACGWLFSGPSAPRRRSSFLFLVLLAAWVILGALSLVRFFAAYFYQVLHHHCPWCLFLRAHGFAGFLLFGLLGLVFLEGTAALLAARTGNRRPELAPAARRRLRRALRNLVLGMLLFWTVAGLPALLWRLRFGVWLE